MVIKGTVIHGEYFDSVSLMILSSKLAKQKGINETSVVMGTEENRAILKNSGFYLDLFDHTTESDLLVAVQAENAKIADSLIAEMDKHLGELKQGDAAGNEYTPTSFDDAIKLLPDANLCLISVAGKYAAVEAKKALDADQHVMIFSDNVSLEDEIELKKYAASKDLLVMGPDCGTAIINGVPLAFANVISRGNIGIVAASGTGLQEVSTLITAHGAGVSQAIGVGGRDIKQEVGGIMMLKGLEALLEDDATEIIVLISKPPHQEVVDKIQKLTKNSSKKIVTIFIGGNGVDGTYNANSLAEAAFIASELSKGSDFSEFEYKIDPIKTNGKYVRGLFSGGTFCLEAQILLEKNGVNEIYSNIPSGNSKKSNDLFKSEKNTVIDLGDDEFTAGRPHPMIDFSIRNKRFLEEASDSDTAIIIFDLVLGFGANMNPLDDILPTLKKIKNTPLVCSVTGTEGDPQNRSKVVKALREIGVVVANSNAHACEIAARSLL